MDNLDCSVCGQRITGRRKLKIFYDFSKKGWIATLENSYDKGGCNHNLDGSGDTIEVAIKDLDDWLKDFINDNNRRKGDF